MPVVEATKTHHPQVDKPLVWDRVKSTERFRFVNESKIVHVVVDDVDVVSQVTMITMMIMMVMMIRWTL